MAEALVAYLHETPLAGLMLVVTLGYLLGRVSWRGIVVGPACGTVVVGLILGHFLGLSLDALYGQHVPDVTVGLFGFSLFIYSVGFEAGPRFFASVRSSSGWRFMLIGALVNIIATGLVVSLGRALDLDASTAAGVLAGSLTSAPTYAAASEIAPDPTRLSVSFALAYPVGLVVLVLVVQTLPHVMRRPLVTGSLRPRDSQPPLRSAWVPEHGTPELTRSVRVVRDDIDGHTLRELELTQRSGCVISAIHRGDQILIPRADTALERDDRLRVTGRVDELQELEQLVGPEVYDARLSELPLRRVQIVNDAVVGRMLQDLDMIGRFGVIITRIERGDMLIEPGPGVVLLAGDTVDLLGEPEDMRAATRELGRREPPSSHTDIAVYAGGIVLGLLIGNLHLDAIGWDLSLGLAGGLLLSGVALGHLGQIGPFSARVPVAARQLVRDLGILLFVGEAALDAGQQLGEVIGYPWKTLLMVSVAATVLPVLVAVGLSELLLRLRPLDTWGSVCGGMTSSAALLVIRRAAGSNEPAVGYATAYAVASVLATVAGQLVIALLHG